MDEKLARMDVDLKAWKSRVETRKKFAQREIDKRTQILKEVRYYIYFCCYWYIKLSISSMMILFMSCEFFSSGKSLVMTSMRMILNLLRN